MLGDDGEELSAAALPIPSSFQCPITQDVMKHPVVTVDGQAYERSAIEQWFRRGNRTSPMTGATLPSLQLTADLPLQRAIEEYLALRPEIERRAMNQLSLEEAARMLESELHEKILLHQSTNHHRDIVKRLVAQLREAGTTFPEAELRATAIEVATELEAMYSGTPDSAASSSGAAGYTSQKEPLALSSSSECSEPPSRCVMDFAGHQGYVRCITGLGTEHVASGSLDCTAKIWSLREGRCLQTLAGHTDGVTSITLIDNLFPTFRFATGSRDNTVKVWEWTVSPAAGCCLSTFEGHGDAVTALATLNERSIVSGSTDHSVRIWNLATGVCEATLSGDAAGNNSVQSLASFSSNYVAVGSSSKWVRIWDVTAGQPLATLQGHRGSVLGVASLAPGVIASSSSDGTVRVWDIGSGKSIAILEGHGDDVNCVSPLGCRGILSGSSDESVKLWDMRRFDVLATLQGHSDSVFGVAAVCIDRALSCSDDKLVKMWGA